MDPFKILRDLDWMGILTITSVLVAPFISHYLMTLPKKKILYGKLKWQIINKPRFFLSIEIKNISGYPVKLRKVELAFHSLCSKKWESISFIKPGFTTEPILINEQEIRIIRGFIMVTEDAKAKLLSNPRTRFKVHLTFDDDTEYYFINSSKTKFAPIRKKNTRLVQQVYTVNHIKKIKASLSAGPVS